MEIEMRIALLVAGVVLLVVLFFLGRIRGRRAARTRKFEDFDFEEESLQSPLDSLDTSGEDADILPDVTHPDEPADEVELQDTEEADSGYQPSLLRPEPEKGTPEEKLVVVHVMAKRPRTFSGSDIVNVVRQFRLEYDDDMRVFHKAVKRRDGKKAMYSIFNAVNPGTFDLDRMKTFETPGISFVLVLPGPEKGLKAFNIMLEAAKRTAERLRGDLLDESHNHLNQQAIARWQEEVQLFSLRHPHES